RQQTSIYLADPQLGGVFSQLGWTGSLIQPECPARFGGGCYKDYLYQVEANIGVNKINQHILSRITHSIQITPERVEHTRQIKYTNNAQSPSWPLGLYKTYLRFYVNAESIVAGVMVNKESLESKYITEYLDHNRKVIGIVVAVPIESEIEVVVKYYTSHQIKKGESYFFFEQSQPGVMNRLSSIALTHPDNLRAELISPLVEVNQNQVVVTSDQGVGFLAIQFAKEQ
ncbi:MAG TPA: hypothetical protein PLM16_03225, partial [Candidatus Woesebacteria bacterium]|nr:hypothetical protein [Candidatus Woesebacteria bacterium]